MGAPTALASRRSDAPLASSASASSASASSAPANVEATVSAVFTREMELDHKRDHDPALAHASSEGRSSVPASPSRSSEVPPHLVGKKIYQLSAETAPVVVERAWYSVIVDMIHFVVQWVLRKATMDVEAESLLETVIHRVEARNIAPSQGPQYALTWARERRVLTENKGAIKYWAGEHGLQFEEVLRYVNARMDATSDAIKGPQQEGDLFRELFVLHAIINFSFEPVDATATASATALKPKQQQFSEFIGKLFEGDKPGNRGAETAPQPSALPTSGGSSAVPATAPDATAGSSASTPPQKTVRDIARESATESGLVVPRALCYGIDVIGQFVSPELLLFFKKERVCAMMHLDEFDNTIASFKSILANANTPNDALAAKPVAEIAARLMEYSRLSASELVDAIELRRDKFETFFKGFEPGKLDAVIAEVRKLILIATDTATAATTSTTSGTAAEATATANPASTASVGTGASGASSLNSASSSSTSTSSTSTSSASASQTAPATAVEVDLEEAPMAPPPPTDLPAEPVRPTIVVSKSGRPRTEATASASGPSASRTESGSGSGSRAGQVSGGRQQTAAPQATDPQAMAAQVARRAAERQARAQQTGDPTARGPAPRTAPQPAPAPARAVQLRPARQDQRRRI